MGRSLEERRGVVGHPPSVDAAARVGLGQAIVCANPVLASVERPLAVVEVRVGAHQRPCATHLELTTTRIRQETRNRRWVQEEVRLGAKIKILVGGGGGKVPRDRSS
jgi:hypothetical protein